MKSMGITSRWLCSFMFFGQSFAVGAVESPIVTTNRITQAQIVSGELTRDQIRFQGRIMFAKPFTQADGFGDGPEGDTPEQRRIPGHRATLQHNRMFSRINGLDAQTCLECHSVVSRRTIPMTFGVGGAGGLNDTVLGAIGSSFIDITNKDHDGKSNIDGRVINPPFIFGAGGVELLAKEMTKELQALKAQALANPGVAVSLQSKGVRFGTLAAKFDGSLDTSGVSGVDSDPTSSTFLVVQPFGRKGDTKTTRTFSLNANQFHFGMQAAEVVGEGVDDDGDGVADEITVGEVSALAIFLATVETPRRQYPGTANVTGIAKHGFNLFKKIGCAGCHKPFMDTKSTLLSFSFPEVSNDPDKNIYYTVDLTSPPMRFPKNAQGGVRVHLFADLKQHHMGETLAEFDGNDLFTTARLWGVADTAPYLHDGRALTLTDAILQHGEPGSDAKLSVDNYRRLSPTDQDAVITFLHTLRTPKQVSKDLDGLARQGRAGL